MIVPSETLPLKHTEKIFALGAFTSPMLHLINTDSSFTRSDGSVMSRIYERLTKASRRRGVNKFDDLDEESYRRGIYDAFKALQNELSA